MPEPEQRRDEYAQDILAIRRKGRRPGGRAETHKDAKAYANAKAYADAKRQSYTNFTDIDTYSHTHCHAIRFADVDPFCDAYGYPIRYTNAGTLAEGSH